jgi:hypothetical protein
MRRLLVAGIAALAVVLGLVVTTGVASAAPSLLDCNGVLASAQCGNSVKDNARRVDHDCAAGTHWNGTACVANTPGTGDPRGHGNWPGNGGPRGGNYGHGFGFPIGGYQGLPGLLNGNLLNLQLLGLTGVGNVSVCSYPTWDSFNTYGGRYGSRWGGVRGHFGGNPAAAWAQLRAQAACNAAVVNGLSGLTLVDGSYLNLGGEFGTVNVCSFSTFNDFGSRFGGRFGNRFNGVRGRFGGNPLSAWNQLRNQASCGSTVVVIPSSTTVVQAPAATAEALPADPSTTAPSADDGASKPLASSPVPSGPVQTGGDSPAYVLAHARAV